MAVASACRGSGTGEGQPGATKKPVTIRITARQVPEQDMWPVRVPAFQSAYPHITVEPDLHAGDIQEKIATLIASNTIADVVHTHPSAAQPQRLFLGGSMRALDTYVARDKLDLKQWYDQAIEAGRLDGKLISLPFKGKMASVALFYNQTLFEQAGLAPPTLNTTLAELTEMAIKLTRPDGSQWGMAGNLPKDARTHTGTIRRWNAELLDREQKKVLLEASEARTAWAWYYDAFHKRRFMDPLANAGQLFQQGKAAMLINMDFNQKTSIQPASEAQGFKYSATLIVKGPTGRRGGIWIPDALQLSTITPNPDEAWLALKWFTDKETGLALALQKSQGTSTTPGARPDVYDDARFLNHELFPRVLQELDRDANKLGEDYKGCIPHNYKIPEFNTALGAAVDKVWKNEAEPTPSFMKTLNDELQNVL
ncbi:MAG TPA: extracellular solute-binding protein, partial [Chloroflexota bacterium]|nr:extracellular solute-binding protein [Chloroflexota bacterium]